MFATQPIVVLLWKLPLPVLLDLQQINFPLSEYYTLGRYDIVTTIEVPNDETIASILLSTESLGNVRSETLRAFSMDEAANPKMSKLLLCLAESVYKL